MTAAAKRAAFPVRVITLPARSVAYIRVANAFAGGRVLTAFKTLIAWAQAQDLFAHGTLFGMSIDDPHVTPKPLYRYEVCLVSTQPFTAADGISKTKLPALRYAVTRVSGDLRKIATAWDYLFRGWLVTSAYEPEPAPALEIFLDKARATDWSHFELELCLPVRPLSARRR